jgi:hypothetical protein
MFSVEFGVIVSQFWSLEMIIHNIADFLSNGGKTTQQIFVSVVISGNIEWRCVTVIQILQIGLNVVHAIDNCCWQLACRSFNCNLAVMKYSKISSAHCPVLAIVLN